MNVPFLFKYIKGVDIMETAMKDGKVIKYIDGQWRYGNGAPVDYKGYTPGTNDVSKCMYGMLLGDSGPELCVLSKGTKIIPDVK